MSLLALLVIIWVICKAVDYHEECEDDRLMKWADTHIKDYGDHGDTYNIDVDARHVSINNKDMEDDKWLK